MGFQKHQIVNMPFSEGRKPLFSGWVGGMVDGDQKCPLIFLIWMYVKDHIHYTYIHTQKLSPRFLWVSKFQTYITTT